MKTATRAITKARDEKTHAKRVKLLRYRLDHAWQRRTKYSPMVKRYLDHYHLVSPHFTWEEFACKDGTQVPASLRKNARRLAWSLEQFRHEIGDKAIAPISVYRTPAYNTKIGGASKSQHMQATAADFSKDTVDRVGRARWFRAAERVFSKGGVGDYPGGSAHLDVRGWKARWRSF